MNDKQVDMVCRSIIAAAVLIADNKGEDMLDVGDEQKQILLSSRVARITDLIFDRLQS